MSLLLYCYDHMTSSMQFVFVYSNNCRYIKCGFFLYWFHELSEFYIYLVYLIRVWFFHIYIWFIYGVVPYIYWLQFNDCIYRFIDFGYYGRIVSANPYWIYVMLMWPGMLYVKIAGLCRLNWIELHGYIIIMKYVLIISLSPFLFWHNYV